MKTSRILGLVAIVLFIVSHFLPAYGDGGSGFECFKACWKMFSGDNADVLSGGWFYYSGFVIANNLFVVLALTLFATKKYRRLRLAVSLVCFLHVLSWLVLHVLDKPQKWPSEIKIGYYLWLIAYGLLGAAHLRKEPTESLDSIPLARPIG